MIGVVDGAYEADEIAGRVGALRLLAVALAQVPDLGDVAGTLEDAATDLERLAASARAAETAVPPTELCGKRDGHLRGFRCDRAAKHPGRHSWEIADLERRGREYDEMVRTVEEVRMVARAARQRAKAAETDRAYLLAEREHWWSRLPRIFR